MVVSSVHRRLRQALLVSTALGGALVLPSLAVAQSLPTGGSVAAGSVTISQPSATSLDIDQTSGSAVVNWQGFSIGAGSAVNIVQPNASTALLNRVTGNTPSTIAGSLTANGQVYLVNPNGIAITSSGTVNTGGFVASSLGISDDDFMSGKRTFTGNGASAAVSNAGTISVGAGGYAALLGGTVSNTGSISVPLGEVGLGSGEQATLDFSGDGFLQVAVPTAAAGSGALIQNAGSIKAEGGSVVISAATARQAARDAVNISGLVEADSIGGHNGSITIGGGDGGVVNISGRLLARGRSGRGGSITVTGQHIALSGARLDASGKTGGGNINIGGGRQGSGPLPHADTVTIDAGTTIAADATSMGDGGNVVVWSDGTTSFAGTISATGGALGGDGGAAEVSSEGVLDYTGFTDLSAANGAFGTLLLDPYNVVISNGANTSGFTASANDSVINVGTLETALSTANVTITTGSAGSQAGNITVADPLTWSSGSLLTLTAANAIAVDAPITIAGGGQLALNYATSDLSNFSFGDGDSVIFAQNANQGSQALSINSQAYTLIRSMADLDGIDGVAAIAGGTITNQTTAGGLSGHYALAGSLDASGTTYTDALVAGGFVSPFSGTFEGLGHTITGLTVNKSGDVAGLFGWVAGGTVRDIGLIGGSVSGGEYVGGLVGDTSANSTVIQTYNTGDVSGTNEVGGLVGTNNGTITKANATGTVRGLVNPIYNYDDVGGLVGENAGTITQAYAAGDVIAANGASNVGGLVGNAFGGSIAQSYATGSVSGSSRVGGLVGWNDSGAITQSYATGAVSGTQEVGGLVGFNFSGTITQAYATGAVDGSVTTSGVSNFYAGGLVGMNQSGSITQAYATGAVIGVAAVGGLAGGNIGGTITSGYYDPGTTGRPNGIGAGSGNVVGLTTAQFQNGTLPTGFDSSVWATANGLYPYLGSFFPNGVEAISGTALNSDGSIASGDQVGIYSDGSLLTGGTASVGANGYYYEIVAAGTLPASNATLGETLTVAGPAGANTASGLAYTDAADASGSIFGLGTLSDGQDRQTTAATSYSALQADLGQTFGASTFAGLRTSFSAVPTSITATGAGFTLDQAVNASAAFNLWAAGDLTIAATGGVTSSASGDAIVLATDSSFINDAGADAVQATNAGGRWLIYSNDPANDTTGGLTYAFKQYNATYGTTPVAQTSGNGLLYTLAPVLTVGLTGPVQKNYDGNTSAALAPSNYAVAGAVDGDTVVFYEPASGTYGTSNPGIGKTVTVSGITFGGATNGAATVYGYQLASTSASASIGTIIAPASPPSQRGSIQVHYQPVSDIFAAFGLTDLTFGDPGDPNDPTLVISDPSFGDSPDNPSPDDPRRHPKPKSGH
ncbi:MAG TPA: filamentous hemagglutinin N-terminal domain-containing protein [Devosiaceae bacterium]|nr:filamentous hemagglutinin N-terminal domain-containing protein [Devosiaceae bacterium]